MLEHEFQSERTGHVGWGGSETASQATAVVQECGTPLCRRGEQPASRCTLRVSGDAANMFSFSLTFS